MPQVKGTENAPGRFIPLLEVDIQFGNGVEGRTSAIVDSGAECTIVPAEVLVAAGIRFQDLPVVGQGIGAGGSFVRARLPAGRITWKRFLVAEAFEVAEPGHLPAILLGRSDFFRRFQVRFSWHRDPPTFDVDPVSG